MHTVMSQNGQTHFKNLAASAARFLKCIWPFWDIMDQRVKGIILNIYFVRYRYVVPFLIFWGLFHTRKIQIYMLLRKFLFWITLNLLHYILVYSYYTHALPF